MHKSHRAIGLPALLLILSTSVLPAQQLDESNYDQLVPKGKEVDAIYGDFALKNGNAKAVIAAPLSSRNANMTVKTIGGCLIDLATTDFESDQLSAFYPGRRKFRFSKAESDQDSVTVVSPGTDARAECVVKYEFLPGLPIMEVTSTWKNTTGRDWTLALEDDIRADAGKENMVKTPNGTVDVFYIDDTHWQQSYAVTAPGYKIRCNGNSRESVLTYVNAENKPVILKPGKSFTLTRQITVGRSLPNVLALAEQSANIPGDAYPCEVNVSSADGHPAANGTVVFRRGNDLRGTVRLDENGSAKLKLPAGEYAVDAALAGALLVPKGSLRVEVGPVNNRFDFSCALFRPGTVKATITDENGSAIPAKVEFIGKGDAPTPTWGPESGEHFVRNLAYTEDGSFEVLMQEGDYDITISHGPEFDAVFTKLKVETGKTAELKASLKHSVQTPGWVSSDFHSHSSPSGDNTGSQRGRVLNLAAENVEFAPCTEHNRISTYDHHITELGLKPFLATVSGMELTGSPLPLNHQNVFPMKHTPRTQDGGGPRVDSSPETQMERLMLWDDRSEKLIQQNHPDIGWLFYDKNGDGKPDEGHSRSFPIMDVMEIHPIDRILNIQKFDVRNGNPFNNQRMLNWLQLLNQGFRVYGVVNTDAHYNFHGSGWLRNWIQSSTDDPAKIDSTEMMHASEQGRLIMSNGPYLEATFSESGSDKSVVSGQDLQAKSGKVTAHVRVQCPNWFDIDTVFVLINGKAAEELTFTREDNANSFSDGVVKFDRKLSITLKEDSHIIVVTGHRTDRLGDVMGPSGGQQHPAALTNPVFVDVDGDGFKPNKDTLGHPLPVKFKKPTP